VEETEGGSGGDGGGMKEIKKEVEAEELHFISSTSLPYHRLRRKLSLYSSPSIFPFFSP